MGLDLSPGQMRQLENQGNHCCYAFSAHEEESRGEGCGGLQDPSQEGTENQLIKIIYKNISGWCCT